MTMKSEGLNERSPSCFIEISKEDAEKHGLEEGGIATVASRRGGIQAVVNISDKVVPGTVFYSDHGYGDRSVRFAFPKKLSTLRAAEERMRAKLTTPGA